MKTIKDLAILFFLGIIIGIATLPTIQAWLHILIFAIVFAIGLNTIIRFMYPENDIDDKIDDKAIEQ